MASAWVGLAEMDVAPTDGFTFDLQDDEFHRIMLSDRALLLAPGTSGKTCTLLNFTFNRKITQSSAACAENTAVKEPSKAMLLYAELWKRNTDGFFCFFSTMNPKKWQDTIFEEKRINSRLVWMDYQAENVPLCTYLKHQISVMRNCNQEWAHLVYLVQKWTTQVPAEFRPQFRYFLIFKEAIESETIWNRFAQRRESRATPLCGMDFSDMQRFGRSSSGTGWNSLLPSLRRVKERGASRCS